MDGTMKKIRLRQNEGRGEMGSLADEMKLSTSDEPVNGDGGVDERKENISSWGDISWTNGLKTCREFLIDSHHRSRLVKIKK